MHKSILLKRDITNLYDSIPFASKPTGRCKLEFYINNHVRRLDHMICIIFAIALTSDYNYLVSGESTNRGILSAVLSELEKNMLLFYACTKRPSVATGKSNNVLHL